MFNPQFTVTQRLLANIKHIAILVAELNNKSFPDTILLEMEKTARAISSYSSTSIEGNPLPLTEVKKILKTKPENIRDTEQEVLNYNLALEKLNKLTKSDLDLALILDIQRIVTNNLIRYIKNNKLKVDFLILAGLFHKQFVIIHPFIDGNGRTARLLTKLLLANMGLNTFNLFSFENYYNQNVTKYFQKVGVLGNYYDIKNKINFTEWLEYFTDGIIDELLRVGSELKTLSITPDTTLESYHKKLLEYIEKHGYINDKLYATLTTRGKATRSLDFQKLITIGLIERFGKGKATYYKLKQ